jgi:hypothetical protein
VNQEIIAFHCSQVGVAGTTRVFVRKVGQEYVARVGIAIFGSTNMTEEELRDADPFSEKFRDNYDEGKGATVGQALEDLKREMKKTAESLWW